MEEGKLHRLAEIDVKGRRINAEGNDTDVRRMGQNAIEVRFVASPGETPDGLAAAATEDEMSADVVQVGQGLLALWDILVEWHRWCPPSRGINAALLPLRKGINAPPPLPSSSNGRPPAPPFPNTQGGVG